MPQSEQPKPEHFLVASSSLIAEFDRQPASAMPDGKIYKKIKPHPTSGAALAFSIGNRLQINWDRRRFGS